MREMLDTLTGCTLLVPEDKVEKYLAVGYKLIADPVKPEPVPELEPAPEPEVKPVKKKTTRKRTTKAG